jgi:hypothetical protein
MDNGDGELGWLPERLRIPGLAVCLNDFAVRRMTTENQYLSTDIVPFARRVAGHHPHNLPFDVSYPEDQTRIQYSNMSYQMTASSNRILIVHSAVHPPLTAEWTTTINLVPGGEISEY